MSAVTAIIKPDSKKIGIFLPKIKSLLHRVYIEEQNWRFHPKNPSGIKIEDDKYFSDKFMDQSTWIVHGSDFQTTNPNVQAACRLIEARPVEIAGYARRYGTEAIQDAVRLHSPKGLVEINRVAVSKEQRSARIFGSVLFPMVFHHLATDIDERPLIYSIPTNLTGYINSWESRTGGAKFGEPFYYEDSDPAPAQMFLLSRSRVRDVAREYPPNIPWQCL